MTDQVLANYSTTAFILPITRYRCHFSAKPDIDSLHSISQVRSVLDDLNAGYVWRGVFGKHLRQSSCKQSTPCAERCEAQMRCQYGKLFETVSLDRDHLFAHLKEIPHPYSLHVEGFDYSDDQFRGSVELTLYGLRNMQAGAQILTALLQAAQTGVGARSKSAGEGRLQLSLDALAYRSANGQWISTAMKSLGTGYHHYLPEATPACPEKIVINLITPMRLHVKGKLVNPAQLEFGHLFNSLLRRISSLCAFYGEPLDIDKQTFRSLKESAARVQIVERELTIKRDSRWSASQQKRLQVHGLKGNITIAGEALQELWPYIWFGSQLQIGKGTTMGFGRLVIEGY